MKSGKDRPLRAAGVQLDFIEDYTYQEAVFMSRAFPPKRLELVHPETCRAIAMDSGTGVPVMGKKLLRATEKVHRSDQRLALHTVGGRVTVELEADVNIPGLPLPFFVKVLPDSPMALPLNTLSKSGYRVIFEDDKGLTGLITPYDDELHLHFVHDVPFVLDVEGVGIVLADDVDEHGKIYMTLPVDHELLDYEADHYIFRLAAEAVPNACAANVVAPEVSPLHPPAPVDVVAPRPPAPVEAAVQPILPAPVDASAPSPLPAAENQDGDNGRPHMPRLASRSVPYLKTEAASDAHCVAHRPFNPECDVCVLSYSRAPPAKAGGFDAKNQPSKFGDLIAMDFKVISEADWFSTSGDKVCLVVLDIATGYRGHYPSSNRSAAFVAESLKAFAGDVRPRRVHCDNADEFEAACKPLRCPSPRRDRRPTNMTATALLSGPLRR